MMSVDVSIDQVANALYGRPCADLSDQQHRELVKRLRWDGLHAEADTLWSRVLQDSIRTLSLPTTQTR